MRTLILLLVLAFSSCRNSKRDNVPSAPYKDTAIPKLTENIQAKKNKAIDTTITYSIPGLSSEGSEAKVLYVNDSIKEAIWNIYGETGKSLIKYQFLSGGKVNADEKNYTYKRDLTSVKSDSDMLLKNNLRYLLDTSGAIITKVKDKDFVNVFPDFKKNIPFVLKN